MNPETKNKRLIDKESVANELRNMFGEPPKEVEESIQKIFDWIDRGLPRATDGAFLSSRCDW